MLLMDLNVDPHYDPHFATKRVLRSTPLISSKRAPTFYNFEKMEKSIYLL